MPTNAASLSIYNMAVISTFTWNTLRYIWLYYVYFLLRCYFCLIIYPGWMNFENLRQQDEENKMNLKSTKPFRQQSELKEYSYTHIPSFWGSWVETRLRGDTERTFFSLRCRTYGKKCSRHSGDKDESRDISQFKIRVTLSQLCQRNIHTYTQKHYPSSGALRTIICE